MSTQFNYFGGVERPDPTRLTTTNATEVFAATDKETQIASVIIANETASPVRIDLEYNDGSTDYLIFASTVAANGTTVFDEALFHLYNGDSIKATAGAANALTVTPVIVRSNSSEVAASPI
jgi:hypothetical protein